MNLYLRNELIDAWRDRDAFACAFALCGVIARQGPGRRTLATSVDGAHYYVKLHSGVGWWEIVKNLLLGRAPVLGAGNEFRAARRLASAGVPSLRVAGFGVRGWNPARQQSFLISDAIEHVDTLEQVAHATANVLTYGQRKRLVEAVADIARDMHHVGVNHRDFYLCHFLRDRQQRLSLIDLHRAQVRRCVPQRWLVKDLGSLYFSAMDAGLNRRDLLRFVRRYNGGALPRLGTRPLGMRSHGMRSHGMRSQMLPARSDSWHFWSAVQRRAAQLYRKGRRHGLVGDRAI